MMTTRSVCVGLISIVSICGSGIAQQTTVSTPLLGMGDGYYEHIGVQWGVQHVSPTGGFFFRSGGTLLPPFGGFDPGARNAVGFGGRSGGLAWHVSVSASQGSTRNSVSTIPSLTVPNGGWGVMYHTVQRPFVTGVVPVVGGRNVSPLEERMFRLRFDQAIRAVQARASAARQAEEEERETARTKAPRLRKPDDPPLFLKGRKRHPTSAHPRTE